MIRTTPNTFLQQNHLPPVGMRILKSAIAIFLCFLIYLFLRPNGIVFYSQLSALWCIQPLRSNMRDKAIQRTTGTLVGAFCGLLIILTDQRILCPVFGITDPVGNVVYAALVALAIILSIYITLLLNKRDASYFSCVVLLSIVVYHIGDANPYLFVWDRVLDTMIGIGVGMGVNSFHLPFRRRTDTLFVSGIDDTLLSGNRDCLSFYSKAELNRMLDEGAHFTLSTTRTPASLLDLVRDIHLRLPIIAMDGAVLYDITHHEYLQVVTIPRETTKQLQRFLADYPYNCFLNLILDGTLLIQYQILENAAEQHLFEQKHDSPFRNYITHDMTDVADCIYIMLLQPHDAITALVCNLKETPFFSQVRLEQYPAPDYPGYDFLKIYDCLATRDNMLQTLQQQLGLNRVVTFGSIPGKYDVIIEHADQDQAVHSLKKQFESPLFSI